jgi:hypothetical protein
MCARKVLQNLLTKSCTFMHKSRLVTLIDLTCSLISCERLTMTELGNELSEMSNSSERHSIKRVSNFLSNPHIQKENAEIQKALAGQILCNFKRVRIIIDWTPAIERLQYILRANLIMKDSSLILYQETYPEKKVNNTRIQNRFLKRLSKIIPSHIAEVLIITDAGFRGEWFKQVEELGCYFCGRVRGKTQIQLKKEEVWEEATTYSKKATGHIKFLGKGLLTKQNQHEMNMYSYKQPLKFITKKSQRNNPNACTELKRQIKSYTEGWFIVTNLENLNTNTKKTIINHYKDRAKIEASNRATKSTKYGFGLSNSMTKSIERIKILLLIEQIASLIAWLVGAYREVTKTAREFFNGSIKKDRRLSLIKLGVRALKRKTAPSFHLLIEMIKQFAYLETSLC